PCGPGGWAGPGRLPLSRPITATRRALCRLWLFHFSAIKPTPMRPSVRLVFAFACIFAMMGAITGCTEVGARRDIQEANKLYYAGKYDEAIKLYKDALTAVPNLAEGWFNLGLAYL